MMKEEPTCPLLSAMPRIASVNGPTAQPNSDLTSTASAQGVPMKSLSVEFIIVFSPCSVNQFYLNFPETYFRFRLREDVCDGLHGAGGVARGLRPMRRRRPSHTRTPRPPEAMRARPARPRSVLPSSHLRQNGRSNAYAFRPPRFCAYRASIAIASGTSSCRFFPRVV